MIVIFVFKCVNVDDKEKQKNVILVVCNTMEGVRIIKSKHNLNIQYKITFMFLLSRNVLFVIKSVVLSQSLSLL